MGLAFAYQKCEVFNDAQRATSIYNRLSACTQRPETALTFLTVLIGDLTIL